MPRSQKRPYEAADAGDLQHVIQMDGVGQLLEERRTRNGDCCHFLAPSAARLAAALSISTTTCCGSPATAAAPLEPLSASFSAGRGLFLGASWSCKPCHTSTHAARHLSSS